MPDNINKEPNNTQDSNVEDIEYYKQKVAELEEKHANLNQGIAKYRDQAQEQSQRVKELEQKIAELEEKLNEPSEKIELADEDEAILESWAREKGFVTVDEINKLKEEQAIQAQLQAEQEAVEEFLKKYPQYDTDENWAKVKAEFERSFKPQATKKGFLEVLEKIHKLLSIPEIEKEGEARALAKLKNKGRLSLGGGSQGSVNEKRQETIDELQKKYPNLSKEQIEARLAEIDALYGDKE